MEPTVLETKHAGDEEGSEGPVEPPLARRYFKVSDCSAEVPSHGCVTSRATPRDGRCLRRVYQRGR